MAPHWGSFGRRVHLIRSMKPLCTVASTMCGKRSYVMNIRISFAKHNPLHKIRTPHPAIQMVSNTVSLNDTLRVKAEWTDKSKVRKKFMQLNKGASLLRFSEIQTFTQTCWMLFYLPQWLWRPFIADTYPLTQSLQCNATDTAFAKVRITHAFISFNIYPV